MSKPKKNDLEAVEQLKQAHDRIVAEIGKVIIGQRKVIDELLISLLSRGHCLLIGVPGLAKTLLISTLSEVFKSEFQSNSIYARSHAIGHYRHRGD